MTHGVTLSNPWPREGQVSGQKAVSSRQPPLSRARSLLSETKPAFTKPISAKPTSAKLSQARKIEPSGNIINDAAIWILSLGGASYAILALVLFTWLTSTQIFVPGDQPVVAMNISSSSKLHSPISRMKNVNSPSMQRRRETAAQVQFVTNVIASSSKLTHSEALKLAKTIVTESLTQSLDPFFVAAIIKRESTFKRHAVSHKGATGLMQLMPATGEYISQRASFNWSGAHKLTEPGYNIRLGIAYIKELHRSFKGNVEHALIAYNWGPANLNRALKNGSHIPDSTVRYARSVIKDHSKWREDYSDRANQFLYMGSLGMVG